MTESSAEAVEAMNEQSLGWNCSTVDAAFHKMDTSYGKAVDSRAQRCTTLMRYSTRLLV